MLAVLLASLMPVAMPAIAAPHMQAARADDRAALEARNHDWLTAYKTRDVATLERILDDGFAGDYPTGKLSKADLLRSVTDPDRVIEDIAWRDLKIEVRGAVATVSALSTLRGTNKGQPFSASNYYVDTYVKRNGVWRAVAAKVTPAVQMQPAS